MLKKQKRGFTLIELLAIIIIIGLFSIVSVLALSSVRARARDTRRANDLETMRKGLEIYYNNYSKYPLGLYFIDADGILKEPTFDTSIGIAYSSGLANLSGNDWDSDSDMQALVKEKILQKLPVDPINNTKNFYYYEPTNKSYCLLGFFETKFTDTQICLNNQTDCNYYKCIGETCNTDECCIHNWINCG